MYDNTEKIDSLISVQISVENYGTKQQTSGLSNFC